MSKKTFQKSGVEGFHSCELVINVCSDMESYLELVRPLHRVRSDQESSSTQTRFNPNLHAFQNPTRAMTNLSVDFADLTSVLKWMHVNDLQDHRSFATKSSTQRPGGVLRILGTKCTITLGKRGTEKGEVLVDCVLPFVSCTQSQVCQLQRLLSEDSTTPDNEETDSISHALQTNVVFFRHRENYDAFQGRYLSPWRARALLGISSTANLTASKV